MSAPAPSLGEAPAPLLPTDSFRRAARVAMWPQVRRLLELEPRLRDPEATDELKRYRVATRRLRAAFRVFGEALPKRAAKEIQPELAELARAVGATRDLDVRIASLVTWAADPRAGARDEVEPLRAAWAAERAEAAAEVQRRLATKRHVRLLGDLQSLVSETPLEAHPKRGGGAVRDRAGSAAWAGFERVRSAARVLDGADLEALHDLRIRAKRLRYTLEFLAPVLGADREWLVARLVELQDHLGALHDAELAATAARAVANAGAATLTEGQLAAIESYATVQLETLERLRGSVAKPAAAIMSAAFARRLARAILGPEEATAAESSGASRSPGAPRPKRTARPRGAAPA